MSRFDVLGCKISITTFDEAVDAVYERVKHGTGGYVCFSNVHTVVTSIKDDCLRSATNDAFMAMPDGRPLSIIARIRDKLQVEQVAGPDFLPAFIESLPGLRHFFFGSSPETLKNLKANILRKTPAAQIAGLLSPPYRKLTDDEIKMHIDQIKESNADIVWVGLGAPKQEYWMYDNWENLKPAVLLGVGAAFDFHAGVKESTTMDAQDGLGVAASFV